MGIGFFAPLPLAMMLPFMAGQSMIMGESFGKGFQYGKRKISSMTNDEFNAMDADDLGRDLATDYSKIIPHLEQAVRASSDFQQMIIQELIKIIPNFVDQLLGGGSQEQGGSGSRLPPAGIPAFLTPIIGPPPQTILDNPQINPPTVTVPGDSAIEKYARRWINPPKTNLTNITFQEISYLLQQRAQGLLFPKFAPLGSILLKRYNELKPVPKTIEDTPGGIEASGATGIVKQIALNIAKLQVLINTINKSLDSLKRPTNVKNLNSFISFAKTHNQLMQANRKYSFVVDTGKSINARPPKLIFKT